MSPAQILERSYATLKRRLIEGDFHAGQRLEAARLSEQMHVSITPVRDVLNRLTGERLVEAVAGGGFYVPMPDESGLRELLEWNALLALHAARGKRNGVLFDEQPSRDNAVRTAQLFSSLVDVLGNREMSHAVTSINDRLHAMRRIDAQVMGDTVPDLAALEELAANGPPSILVKRIREFHRRRKAKLPAYVRLLRLGG